MQKPSAVAFVDGWPFVDQVDELLAVLPDSPIRPDRVDSDNIILEDIVEVPQRLDSSPEHLTLCLDVQLDEEEVNQHNPYSQDQEITTTDAVEHKNSNVEK